MTRRIFALALAAASLVGIEGGSGALLSTEAAAQQMGTQPYSFNRNPSLAAQFQYGRSASSAAAASSSNGLAALHQYVTSYNSSSTSIGNMNTVTQILSDGSHGSVGQSTDQTSIGDQGSEAETKTTIDNSVTVKKSAENTDGGTNQEVQ